MCLCFPPVTLTMTLACLRVNCLRLNYKAILLILTIRVVVALSLIVKKIGAVLMSIVGLSVQVIRFLATRKVPYNLAIFGPSTTRKCRQRYRRLKIRVGAARRAVGHDRCPWRADVPRRRAAAAARSVARWVGVCGSVTSTRRSL